MRASLRADLTAAIKSRDRVAIAALRSALAAIDNAESVPADPSPVTTADNPHIAGAATGLGATEVQRRHLTEADHRAILETEITDRTTAAAEYTRLGRTGQATQLDTEAEFLRRYL